MNEETLFAAALDKRTAAERKAFLDARCAGDAALRQRVERLLAAHLETLGILDHRAGPPGWLDRAEKQTVGGVSGERSGAVLAGRYRLLEEIGSGGMGTVWKAEQTQPVRRIVALKLIKAGMDSCSVLSRFEAERQALALMDHPNIARVLDGGTTESGRPFFVMEFVEGVPFTRFCDDARLSIAQRLALFIPVCQAVQHAHTKGVVHRDLKPSNILICQIDGQAVPKVIDFGLAKAILQPLTESTLQTAQGVLLGTPLYMSPEQAEFNNPDVDARTDVYALGVILYELLTGTTPLERTRFKEAALQELLRLIKEEEPPPPSARLSDSDSLPSVAAQRQLEPLRLARQVRGELDWIVMKCLEKDRGRRYETASGLARDVERYLADEPVEASPPSAVYRLGKFIRRHFGYVLAASLIFFLLVSGVVGTTAGLIRADRALKAEAERAEGERQASALAQKRLRQIEKGIEILASIFQDLDPHAEETERRPLRVILGDRLDQAAADLDSDAVGDPLVVANLQDRLGRTYRALGHATKAKALLAKAVAIRQAQLGPEHADTLAVLSQYAGTLTDLGQFRDAVAIYESVRAAQLRANRAEDRETLSTANRLAMAYWKLGRWNDACTLEEHVRDGLLNNYGPDDSQTVDALDNLSAVYATVGKVNEAIALAIQVRDVRVAKFGAHHHLAFQSLNNLAARYQAAGKMKKALTLFEEARDAIVPRLGAEHPTSLHILDNLARMYRAFQRTAESIKLAAQVRETRIQLLGEYHPDTIYTTDNLGKSYQMAGERQKALAMFEKAAAGLEKLEFVHAAASLIIYNICDCLETLDRPEVADHWRRKWLAATRKREGIDSVPYADVLVKVGEDWLRRKRLTTAERSLRDCVAILDKEQPRTVKSFHARSLLGDVLLQQKQYALAEPLLIEAYEGLKACEQQLSPLYARWRICEALERVARLYEASGQTQKAGEWRMKLRESGEVRHKS